MKVVRLENIEDRFFEIEKTIYTDQERKLRGNTEIESLYLDSYFLVIEENEVLARAVLYIHPCHKIENKQAGTVGYYEAIDNLEATQLLLSEIEKVCQEKGINRLIGPINGSTWNTYRFRNNSRTPLFFSEFLHKEYYESFWRACGFSTLMEYSSNLVKEQVKQPLKDLLPGLKLRKVNLERFEQELDYLHSFFEQSFKNAFLFSSIDKKSFVEKYMKYLPYLKEDLIWLIEKEGEVGAVVFALHNHFDLSGESYIIKTLARSNNREFRGTGQYLLQHLTNLCIEMGYQRVIHAFMQDENGSALQTSGKFNAEKYSAYRLLIKSLD